jgi:hypothetical protein
VIKEIAMKPRLLHCKKASRIRRRPLDREIDWEDFDFPCVGGGDDKPPKQAGADGSNASHH